MARKYRRDKRGRFAGGGGSANARGGSSVTRPSAPRRAGTAAVNRIKQETRSRAVSAAYRAAAQGITVSKVVKGVEVRANVSFRPAPRDAPPPPVRVVGIPTARTGRRRERRG